MNDLFPATMLFALSLFPQNLSAQSATHCPMTADDANCVRVVACIGDEGVLVQRSRLWAGRRDI